MSEADVTTLLAELRTLRAEVRGLRTEERRLGVRDVAAILGCSVRKVWRLVAERKLAPGLHVGKARRWTVAEVDDYRATVR